MSNKETPLHAWWQKHGLKAVVFITGGAILVIEITATRILSPFYGNTIFTVSAVISVILGALAIGYARGGREADETPTYREFYGIIYKSGMALLLLTVMTLILLPIGGDLFSLRMGPLVWSVLLFFPPSYLMGKLSPFAIKLAHMDAHGRGLGELSGSMFFWSTAGSISGSILAGFVLIPHLGITNILFSVTALIIIMGGVGVLASHPKGKRRTVALQIFFLLIFTIYLFTLFSGKSLDPRVRYTHDGVYEKLSVVDMEHAGRPARFFLQDRSGSGAVFLDGDDHAFAYTKYGALGALAGKMERALVIGAGVYTIPKSLLVDYPEVQIDAVEIEPSLEYIARTYFRLPVTPHIQTHIMDGRRYLRESNTSYDLIVSDVYHSLYSIPTHFTTKEFFQSAEGRLAEGGVFIANVIANSEPGPDSLLFSEVRTMREVFAQVAVFAVTDPKDTRIQNFILMGIKNKDIVIADALRKSEDPFLRSLPEHLLPISLLTLEQYDILTDDFAPVDNLVTKFIGKDVAEENIDTHTMKPRFSGERAMADIRTIVSLGSRAIATSGNKTQRDMIVKRLEEAGVLVTRDAFLHTKKNGERVELENIIGRVNPDATKRIIIGTHHDSIARAYRDARDPNGFMPGANNSASGVALLLGTLDLLKEYVATTTGIDIVFFDGEEGELALGAGDPNWSPLGSTHFVKAIRRYYPEKDPDHAVILDMVCDSDLQLYREVDSARAFPAGVELFWSIGGAFAPTTFARETKHRVNDDHTPFLNAGIPAMLVIDFDFLPWWNTTEDTPERCSPQSLELVGNTLLSYLKAVSR